MPLSSGEEINAHSLSDLGKVFEARIASLTGDLENALLASQEKLAELQQQLDRERSVTADLKHASTNATLQLTVAQARESLVQDMARIDERANLALRLSERASETSTAVKAEMALEMGLAREIVAEARAHLAGTQAEHARLADHTSAQIADVRASVVADLEVRIAEEAERILALAHAMTAEAARLEADQAYARTMDALALRDADIAYLDDRVDNISSGSEQVSGNCDSPSCDANEEFAAALKAQLMSDIARIQADTEQRLMTAITEVRARTAALARTLAESRSPQDIAADDDAAVAGCLNWLVHHGATALDETSGFEMHTAWAWSDRTFVNAAYRWFLNRHAEPAGLEHHSHMMRYGKSRRQLLIDIAGSAEAQGRLHQRVFSESEDGDFLSGAYTQFLGRSIDIGGQEHYLQALTRKGQTGRGHVLNDIAHSREAHLNRTTLASAWRFAKKAQSHSLRWREALKRINPYSRIARRRTWQMARLAMLEADQHRAGALSAKHTIATREHLAGLVDAIFTAEQTHMAEALANAFSGTQSSPTAPAVAPPPAVTTLSQALAPSLGVLLGDTSAHRQASDIARAIRMEIQELGL